MNVVLLNLAYPSELKSPEELLRRFRVLPGWCDGVLSAMRSAGVGEGRITVIQRFGRNDVVERNGVVYRFVDDGLGENLRWWQSSRPVVKHVVAGCRAGDHRRQSSVVHLNGLGLAAAVPSLRRVLPSTVPIFIQHHAEKPRTGLPGFHQRWALARSDGFFFADRGVAETWIDRGAIRRDALIFEVMEGSTTFTFSDRAAARRQTGLTGSPVFLWVGRLDANKDPLAVLDGLESVLAELPEARLYMAHGPDSPLLWSVEARIAVSEGLRRAVRLLGTVPHAQMEGIFNSADYFVLGSHYEGSGFALAEALACGVIPIVTDIPSFRRITDGGAVGELWPPGRPDALTVAIRKAVGFPLAIQSAAARARFDAQLSFAAIGRDVLAAYRSPFRKRTVTR